MKQAKLKLLPLNSITRAKKKKKRKLFELKCGLSWLLFFHEEATASQTNTTTQEDTLFLSFFLFTSFGKKTMIWQYRYWEKSNAHEGHLDTHHLPISADLLSIILYIAFILWSVFPIHLSVLSVLLTTASLWKIRCHLEFIFVCRLGSPPSSFPFVSRLQATVPSSFGFLLGLLFLCRPILPFSFTFPFQNILIFPSPVQNTRISRENSLAKSSHPRQTTNFQSKLRS